MATRAGGEDIAGVIDTAAPVVLSTKKEEPKTEPTKVGPTSDSPPSGPPELAPPPQEKKG